MREELYHFFIQMLKRRRLLYKQCGRYLLEKIVLYRFSLQYALCVNFSDALDYAFSMKIHTDPDSVHRAHIMLRFGIFFFYVYIDTRSVYIDIINKYT